MKKEENKQLTVIPTAELLSEMESLVVYAGNGISGTAETYKCTFECNIVAGCVTNSAGNCCPNNVSNCGEKCSLCDIKVNTTCLGSDPKYKIPCT